MLSPTILSINWFFSFILLRHLDGIQRNSQASIFRNTMVQRIFLYCFERKTRGPGFWTILIYFVYTGTSATVGAFHWGGDSSLTTGYEGERSGQNHWTDMPQGTRNESCGCFGKRTPFLRWRAQLHRMWEKEFIGDDGSQVRRKGLLAVVRIFWEVDVRAVSPNSTTRMREKAKCNIYVTFRNNKP